jgi:hypothetical protein
MSVVHKAGYASLIHQNLGWHAAELEEVDLLPIQLENTRAGIREPNKWKLVGSPVILKRGAAFRSDNDDRGGSLYKFLMVKTQLRHMPLAEWSGKAAIKDQENIGF